MNRTTSIPRAYLSEDARDELALRVCREILASDDAKGSLPRRWEKNEALYNLDPKATNLTLVEGMASYPVPLWKAKAKRIVDTAFKGCTSMDPYVQVLTDDGQNSKADDIERALMLLSGKGAKQTTFDRALRQCLRITANTGVSVMYVYPDERTWDVCFRAIHPKDLMVYPHELGSLEEAKTVGHRFELMRSEITARKEAGIYLTDEVGGGGASVDNEAGKSKSFARTEDTSAMSVEDELIECWQVVTEVEGQRYLVVVAAHDQKLLRVQPYPYSRKFYFDIRFEDEYGSFWPASSVGQDVQALQLLYTDLHNVIIQGSYAAAFPVMVVSGGSLATKVSKYGPGSMLEVPTGVQAQVLGTQFNPGVLPEMIQQVEKVTDAQTGISQLGTSINLPASTSATAAQGLLAAQDEAKDGYTEFVAPAVGAIFEFLAEVLKTHFREFSQKYGPSLRVDYSSLSKPYIFEATGKTATSSPQALIGKLQMLLQMAMSPNSGLDYRQVETQILQALNLPLDVQSLQKQDVPQQMLALLQQALASGMDPQTIVSLVSQAVTALAGGQPNGQPTTASSPPGIPGPGVAPYGAGGGVPGAATGAPLGGLPLAGPQQPGPYSQPSGPA